MNPPSTPPTHARFPHVKQQAGHYESFYLKACHPDGGLGVWIRYTVHKSPNQAPKGFIWFTLFDAAAGVRASKVEFATPETGAGDYIRFGDHRFAPGRIEGRADSQQLDASWQLSFAGSEPPLWHLPAGFMYNAPFPRTKVLSPHPNVVFQGQIDAAEIGRAHV